MKPGDIVKVAQSAPEDWLPSYRKYRFEVCTVLERRCVVKMIGGVNPERYIFTEKEHFEISEESLTE